MPDRVVLIAVPAICETAIVAVARAIIERDPAATRVAASWEPFVVAITVAVADPAAATLAVAVLVIALIHTPVLPLFAVAVLVVSLCPALRPLALSGIAGVEVYRWRVGAGSAEHSGEKYGCDGN